MEKLPPVVIGNRGLVSLLEACINMASRQTYSSMPERDSHTFQNSRPNSTSVSDIFEEVRMFLYARHVESCSKIYQSESDGTERHGTRTLIVSTHSDHEFVKTQSKLVSSWICYRGGICIAWS